MNTLPLTRLPQNIDYCLFLIGEELKTRRFFNGLRNVGIEDVSLQPGLDRLILKLAGLDDGADATYEFHSNIMDHRCEKIEEHRDSLAEQAFKVYVDLASEKRRRKRAG